MLGYRSFLRDVFAWSVPAALRTGSLKMDGHATRGATVHGHGKILACGQLDVLACGQLEVLAPL
jgi:hypothetical protein